jgi:hypothetical protein
MERMRVEAATPFDRDGSRTIDGTGVPASVSNLARMPAKFATGRRMHAGSLVYAVVLWLCLYSCATPRGVRTFRVVAANPYYLIRSPDAAETPFPEVLSRYSDVGPPQGWLLHSYTQLRVENAYYREGVPKHGIADFLGTQTAVYRVGTRGLQLVSVRSDVARRPADQPPVQDLIGPQQRRYRYYRYFFQIVFRQTADIRGAVLLGADSLDELNRLAAALLADPDAVCGGPSKHCAAFPEACTVALQMEVSVNGVRSVVGWGNTLGNVVEHPRTLKLSRIDNGALRPVEVDAGDPNALRLPLLPGDRIEWE